MMWTVGMADRDPERNAGSGGAESVRQRRVAGDDDAMHGNAARALNGDDADGHRPHQQFQPQEDAERMLFVLPFHGKYQIFRTFYIIDG